MLSNPSVAMYSVEDLLKNVLQEAVPSIVLYIYEEEDIIKFQNAIPKLKPIKGTMKTEYILLQQQEVTLMIKDKSTDATAQKVSLELEGLRSAERDEDSDYSRLFRRGNF